MNAPNPPVKPGDIVAGKYRVDRILGMGGMGVVIAATHVELLEQRALKFLLPNAVTNAEAIERFMREARAASRLKSEHVARVHDVGKLEDGSPYMVMEYLDGYDLGAAIKQYGAIPLETSIFYVLQALEALADAHSAGIIHRDLKPANLFLTVTPDGIPCVKVLDFGISKISGADSNEMDVTKTHAVLGSPHFMCPEQMHSSRDVDARADIWSLGVILYQLTTGRLPFRGRSVTEIVAMVLSGPPPPPSTLAPHLPPGFDAVVLRCLRMNREERFASIGELAVALTPFAPPAAAFTLDRIARVASSFVRKSGGAMPVATAMPQPPTSSPGYTPAPYSAPASVPPQPVSQVGRTSIPYGQPAPLTALPGMQTGPAPLPTATNLTMATYHTSSVPTNAYGTNVATRPLPGATATPLPVPPSVRSPSPSLHDYPAPNFAAMSAPPPTSTAPLPMPQMQTLMPGQTFVQPTQMAPGMVTGAWGGTQMTSNPSTSRAIYVLSAVIAFAVLVLVVLQFLSSPTPTSTASSAVATKSSAPVSTDKPSPVVSVAAPPTTSASAVTPPEAPPSATTKKKVLYDDPFGSQRR